MLRRPRRPRRRTAPVTDRHLLYSAAVQSVDVDIEFFRRVYRGLRGGSFRSLREDFCGTALLACDWVRRSPEHRAWGIDLDRRTLDWGRERYVTRLGRASARLELLCGDVLEVEIPPVDVVAALNFSYCVFKARETVLAYFRRVRRGLRKDGLFFLDIYGGTEAICPAVERRRIDAVTSLDGTKIPAFTYVWEQATFNPVDHHTVCHIHFELPGGRRLRSAFTYDWRLWTVPELRDLLAEAGFASSEVYVEGWDDEADDTDGIYRRRTRFENQDGWVAYVVGVV